MRGEIIAIGDELTTGRILNSTSNFAARHLFAAGHELIAMHTIGDDSELIGEFLLKALARADFVIVTGGLGATTDDLTNEAVSSSLHLPPTFHPEILRRINSNNATKNDKQPAGKPEGPSLLEKLAWLPAGAEVLKPHANMAGYLLVHEGKPIFFLPGVPHEMKELLAEVVVPRLASWNGRPGQAVFQKIYRVFGAGETEINARLRELEQQDVRLRIGYYPVFPEVHVSLTVLDDSREAAEDLFRQTDAAIVEAIGPQLFGCGADTLETVVGGLLLRQKKTLATAESCTGGLISHAITKASGSSGYFIGGIVAYSNELKEQLLGVDHALLQRHGAVSPQTARAMAEGARRTLGADIALSVTGIAGPTGGSPEKPVGTVFFGLATQDTSLDFHRHFFGDRVKIQIHTAYTALDILRRQLLAEED